MYCDGEVGLWLFWGYVGTVLWGDVCCWCGVEMWCCGVLWYIFVMFGVVDVGVFCCCAVLWCFYVVW